MFRLALSILLVFAFSGASAASVMHGLDHGSDHVGPHAEMVAGGPSADAETALADCCDATGGMGSASCFGDIVISAVISPIAPAGTMTSGVLYAGPEFSGPTLAVPTGPPKA